MQKQDALKLRRGDEVMVTVPPVRSFDGFSFRAKVRKGGLTNDTIDVIVIEAVGTNTNGINQGDKRNVHYSHISLLRAAKRSQKEVI